MTKYQNQENQEIQNNQEFQNNQAIASTVNFASLAPYVQAASNKFAAELSADKAANWPFVLAKTIPAGTDLKFSWWLYAQWLLCKVGEALPEGTHHDYLCNEVCSLYELGCNNALVWSDVIAAIDEANEEALTGPQSAAIKALHQIAQTGLTMVLEQKEKVPGLIDRTLDLACLAIMTSDNTSREEVFELAGSQFLHAISLAAPSCDGYSN
jgi:hypothetical protein